MYGWEISSQQKVRSRAPLLSTLTFYAHFKMFLCTVSLDTVNAAALYTITSSL